LPRPRGIDHLRHASVEKLQHRLPAAGAPVTVAGMRSRQLILLLGALALAALAVWRPAGGALPGGRGPAGEGGVARVVDGDTVHVALGGHDETVRYIGIDTPESVKPDTPG